MRNRRVQKKERLKRYHDLLEMARLVSWCTERDYLIRNCLEFISHRLGKRARCALMEGGELKICCWAGEYDYPIGQVPICGESVVWKAVRSGQPLNLTHPQECEGYRHTLPEGVKIKSIIPLRHVDSLSQEEKIVGALVVDSGKEGIPISTEDFEYLKDVGDLIGGAVGKADLIAKLIECKRVKEAMVMDTIDAFRNRIAAIGVIARRIERMAQNPSFVQETQILMKEVKLLEGLVEQFEENLEN